MNKVLKTLVLSDLFIMSSFGLIQPVFAVFMISHITGSTVTAIGVAATVQMFTKAVTQIWVARWTDEEKGNCRELYTLIAGSFLMSLVPFAYALSTKIWHIYAAQFFLGLGQAFSYPSWRVLFGRYIDNDRAGFQWGVYDTITGFGIAAAAALGSFLAEAITFRPLFVIVGCLSIAGSFFLIHIFNQEFTCRVHFHLHKNT